MADVVLTWWSRLHPTGPERDERGTTALEWVMIVALLVSAVVLVATAGTAWTRNAA